jgi:Phage-related protein
LKKPLVVNEVDIEKEGVKIISLPPIKLSTKRVTEKEVEGRDGTLTEYDGYTSDTKNVEADYKGNNPLKILSILEGVKEVIFGNLPDRYYKCRLDNQIPLEQVIENQLYNFLISFKCQPFGYLLEGKETIELISPNTIYNGKATYKSKPIITVYGNGPATLTVNNKAFNITEIGGQITLDSDVEEVYEDKGQYFETDSFPVLVIGENSISWTGNVSKVEIIPNWRCL